VGIPLPLCDEKYTTAEVAPMGIVNVIAVHLVVLNLVSSLSKLVRVPPDGLQGVE
jgi:hypothetical protein